MSGRIPIVDVAPVVDAGTYPAKASVGEPFTVSATVFREGHDAVNADAVLTAPDGSVHQRERMTFGAPGTDRWHAVVTPNAEGDWTLHIEGWGDPIGTWRHDAAIKVPAGIDTDLMLEEGARLAERVAGTLDDTHAQRELTSLAATLRDTNLPPTARLGAAFEAKVATLLDTYPIREPLTESAKYPVFVQRTRALFGSWYEFFPRSEGSSLNPPRSGTFAEAAKRLPKIAAMGFDIVYLPPIHPIGVTARKGPNNTLTPGPDDPGVPWAIGGEAGGHDAIHPDLGTFEDFDAFVAQTRELGMEVALDFALQASPDHPWVTSNPKWFSERADGSIAYAENPPKKYQDIYPINFDRDKEGIYAEALRVVKLWISHDVRVFRVDNPHTKAMDFWHWLISEVRKTDPDVIFLAEAFTRPAIMRTLGKVGYDQSYTYFTWRTGKAEIEAYFTELSTETSAYMRPNFFVNTPDILHASLQYGGPPMFKIRAALAATGSPTWGVYSGYELYEHVALRPGSEEYLDSEKYQYRPRDWDAYEPGGPRAHETLAPYLTRLNEIRRQHPALQQLRNLTVHRVDSDSMIVYSKRDPNTEDTVIIIVNLDSHGTREATVQLTMPALGFDWQDRFTVHDEITGQTWNWGEYNYVRLDPYVEPAHILSVRRGR